MSRKQRILVSPFMLSTFLLVYSSAVFSAPLPQPTQEVLKDLKLDPSAIAGLDQELKVPEEWKEKARKEGKLKIIGTSGKGKQSAFRHLNLQEKNYAAVI